MDLEALDLPGVPEDADIAELHALKVADVWGCAAAFAAAASLGPEELLEAATEEAGYEARGAAIRKEEVEKERSRKSRERILPADGALQKIARYELTLAGSSIRLPMNLRPCRPGDPEATPLLPGSTCREFPSSFGSF
jgi:hypothetical protein